MTTAPFDVIVCGLGAMGSAAVFHLARSGLRVLGLDRFSPPHTQGSTHGQTRIIREAYFEHPSYVPLVQRAYELWADLEQLANQKLFLQTGGVMIGPPDGVVVSGAKRSAIEHRLAWEYLSAAEVRRRFPAMHVPEDMVAVFEPRAGVLYPELCVETHLTLARQLGAAIHVNEPIVQWQANNGRVRVVTAANEFEAGQLVFSAGAWVQSLLPELRLPFKVERQVMFWLETKGDLFGPDRCPIFIGEHEPHRFFYGFPDLGQGFKIARHHEGLIVDPNAVPREVSEADIEPMREIVERIFPEANGRLRESAVCLYTNTPDEHFLIDFHPDHRNVLVVSPCSGHGFKFSSAIGEAVSDLLTHGKSRHDLSLFRWRF
jgi:sarcosine oxidase